MSRVEDYGATHPICKLPDADARVVNCFREVGPFLNIGNGPYPVTWQELNAYSDGAVAELTAWEKSNIAMMSSLYCSYINIGKKPSEPPYQREFDEEDIKAQNESISRVLDREEAELNKLES